MPTMVSPHGDTTSKLLTYKNWTAQITFGFDPDST